MLSFTSSNLPKCLFQEQHEAGEKTLDLSISRILACQTVQKLYKSAQACDALQLLLGENEGPCARCQYIEVTSPFAENGLRKAGSYKSRISTSSRERWLCIDWVICR